MPPPSLQYQLMFEQSIGDVGYGGRREAGSGRKLAARNRAADSNRMQSDALIMVPRLCQVGSR
jgi:hypothetical protein